MLTSTYFISKVNYRDLTNTIALREDGKLNKCNGKNRGRKDTRLSIMNFVQIVAKNKTLKPHKDNFTHISLNKLKIKQSTNQSTTYVYPFI